MQHCAGAAAKKSRSAKPIHFLWSWWFSDTINGRGPDDPLLVKKEFLSYFLIYVTVYICLTCSLCDILGGNNQSA